MTFSEKELESYLEICKQTDTHLLKILSVFLESKYSEVYYCPDKYVYAVGSAPVALLAHCDTVFKTTTEEIFYDREKNVIWSPDGGIGDDRIGVYGIIRLINSLKDNQLPSIIFTNGEEKGGLGAVKFVGDFAKPKSPLKYLIELDRQGYNDCVFYDCDNPKFEKYIEGFGFKTDWGSFTDISTIAPAWHIAAVNLSIGYLEEHSYSERLYVDAFFRTINIVKKMILASYSIKKFKYIPRAKTFNYFSTTPYFYEDVVKCDCCGQPHDLYELIAVEDKVICPDCFPNQNVEWCTICGFPHFITDDSAPDGNYICAECRKGMYED